MKTKLSVMQYFKYFWIIVLFVVACNTQNTSDKAQDKTPENTKNNKPTETMISAKINDEKNSYKLGDEIKINLNFDKKISADRCIVEYNDKIIDSISTKDTEFVCKSINNKLGNNTLYFTVYEKDQKYQSSVNFILLPDKSPKSLSYKVINTFPHDHLAYTQGLFYKDGFLYEATGLKGESTVRKVEIKTGKVIRSFAIPTEIFGEGITYYDDKIAQLSWNAGRGFVYRFSDFKLLNEFTYNGEGWGLEHYNNHLYMTDGTSTIRILSDQNYTLLETIEVYDDNGPVKYLNEIEFIKGKLWANIYRHEKIAVINPKNGMVEAYIDLSRLLPMNDYTSDTDVLNGIAYDETNNRIFVTGKKWPKLFEITVK